MVQILDVLVPHVVDQLVDVFKIFETMLPVVAEQVIQMPKIILQDRIPQRPATGGPSGGTAGGSANNSVFVEQTADIPVHDGVKRARRDLQGDFPGQGSKAPRGADNVGLQGRAQVQGSTALLGAESVGFLGFVQGQDSTALPGAD